MRVALASGLAALAAMVAALASLVGGHTSTFEDVVVTGSLTVLTSDGGAGASVVGTVVHVYDYADRPGLIAVGDLPDAGVFVGRGLLLQNSAPNITISNTTLPVNARAYNIYENIAGQLEINSIRDDGTLPGTLCDFDFYHGTPFLACIGSVGFNSLGASSLVLTKELRSTPHALNEFVNQCDANSEGTEGVDIVAGGASGHPTRRCRCSSDGAGHYAWQNTTTGHIGTATTCPD